LKHDLNTALEIGHRKYSCKYQVYVLDARQILLDITHFLFTI